MEVEWLKKNLPSSPEALRRCIDPNHQQLTVARQCELLDLPRSTWYYAPAGETAENLALMKQIDAQYLQTPFYGSRKVALELGINRKHAQRLMRRMGLEAVGVKRRTTRPAAGHKIYPYLLRNLGITRPDQVWASDITYIPLRHGFLYLTAVMDWFSRYVLAWRLSNTLEGRFCLEALDEALGIVKRFKPEALVVSLGLDIAKADPTGTWSVTPDGLYEIGRRIGGLKYPTLLVQEGGYNIRFLGRNASRLLTGVCAGSLGRKPKG